MRSDTLQHSNVRVLTISDQSRLKVHQGFRAIVIRPSTYDHLIPQGDDVNRGPLNRLALDGRGIAGFDEDSVPVDCPMDWDEMKIRQTFERFDNEIYVFQSSHRLRHAGMEDRGVVRE